MNRKLGLLLVVLLMLFGLSVSAEPLTAASAETAVPVAAFDISAPDDNGYFTVDLTFYNATFKGFLATLEYDGGVVIPVSAETKEKTESFEDFASVPVKAKGIDNNEENSDWLLHKGSKIEENKLSLIYVLNNKVTYPNSIVSQKFQALADENGLNAARFYFKKIADGKIEFKLSDNKLTPNGFALINANGMQSCKVQLNYPEDIGESLAFDIDGSVKTKNSDESEADADTTEKRIKARSNGTVFLQINNYATVSDSLLKWIDKSNNGVVPYIKDNYTMVPLRYIAEELNSEVSYNEATQEITIENSKTVLVFKIGSLTYTDDGLKKSVETAPEIKNGRTFVPLRAVSEALNRSVAWLEDDKIVVIAYKEYPWEADNKIEKELLQEIKLMISPMVRDFAYMSEK